MKKIVNQLFLKPNLFNNKAFQTKYYFSTITNSKFSSENEDLKISSLALNKLKQIKESKKQNNIHLRIIIESGGCSGFQYKLNLENDSSLISSDDIIFNFQDEKIVIDKLSLNFIKGSTIEYIDSMIKSGFYIKENPTADQSCSCGTSFSPKLENNKVKH